MMTCPHCARREAEIDTLREWVRQLEIERRGEWTAPLNIGLTLAERLILETLMATPPGRPVSRWRLFDATRAAPNAQGEEARLKVVDVGVSTLRRKLRPHVGDPIRTIWGVGYMLTPAGRAALLRLTATDEARAA